MDDVLIEGTVDEVVDDAVLDLEAQDDTNLIIEGGIQISVHAIQRVRKRCGIQKKAVPKLVREAMEQGRRHSDFSGKFCRYLDGVFLKEKSANNMRVHNGFLFLFRDQLLITAWPVPPQFRKAAA